MGIEISAGSCHQQKILGERVLKKVWSFTRSHHIRSFNMASLGAQFRKEYFGLRFFIPLFFFYYAEHDDIAWLSRAKHWVRVRGLMYIIRPDGWI